MGNNTCDIVKDLMPLYVDNVLSDASRKYVDEHISDCEDCKKKLESMSSTKELPINPDIRQKEAEGIKNAKKSILKRIIAAVLITAAVVIAIVAAVFTVRHVIRHNNEINILGEWDENGTKVIEFNPDGTAFVERTLEKAGLRVGDATYYFSMIDVVRIIQGNNSVEMRVHFTDNQYKDGHLTLYLMDDPYLELDQE